MIRLSPKERLIAVMDCGLREYHDSRSQLIRRGRVSAQIETCRGEYRSLVICAGLIFWTGRAETEDAARAAADTYIHRVFAETRVIAFPALEVVV